jgi:O-antigen/teichoic acid export membrane protein
VSPIFGENWLPAIPILRLFLAQAPLDALAAVLLPLIYATGQARKGLSLSLVWAGLSWVLSLLALSIGLDWRLLPAVMGLATLIAVSFIIRHLPAGLHVPWKSAVGWPAMTALLLGGLLQLVIPR